MRPELQASGGEVGLRSIQLQIEAIINLAETKSADTIHIATTECIQHNHSIDSAIVPNNTPANHIEISPLHH